MNEKGFSLIEMAVTIAIVAVSAAIAIPNYQQWVAKDDLKNGVVNLKGALQIARITAIATGQPTAVAFFKDPNGNDQYGIFLDTGVGDGGVRGNGILDSGSCEIVISPTGQQLPAPPPPCIVIKFPLVAPLDQSVQKFKTGVTFAVPPVAIEFLSSGRRSLPAGVGNQVTTLTNGFGLTRDVTVSALGDIM